MRKEVPMVYTNLIQDMYEDFSTSVKNMFGVTKDFNVGVGVHQGSVLKLYLFYRVMDEVTKEIQGARYHDV